MDFNPYILLIPTAFVLGINGFAVSCKGNNCKSTDTSYMTTIEDGEMELYSLDPDLRDLRLDNCNNLTVLELTPNLRTLEIAGCRWGRFEMTEISAVGNLTSLRFRDGRLLKLDREQFVKLSHLEILELGGNDIVIVSGDTFKGLSQLWMLALNENRILVLEDSIFHPLPQLRQLDLSGNSILKLPDAVFDQNPILQVMLLNRNHLISLYPYTLAILKNLVLLDLSNNYLNMLQLLSAETIILDNSRVNRMEVLGNVKKFQARNNVLEYLHFRNQVSVTELDLHGNKLTTKDMSDMLKGMWRLQRLDISANLASELPSLKANMLDEDKFFILPSLRFLNISSNLLEHLHGDSPLLSPSLLHLDLSYNRICEVDPSIFGMVNSLQSLHIEGNRLDLFRYDLFHNQQEGLQEVALYDNDFTHDRFKEMTQYFKEAGVQVLEQAHSEGLTSGKEKASMEECVRTQSENENFMGGSPQSIEQIGPSPQKEESTDSGNRQSGVNNTFRKLSLWNFLILFSLLLLWRLMQSLSYSFDVLAVGKLEESGIPSSNQIYQKKY